MILRSKRVLMAALLALPLISATDAPAPRPVTPTMPTIALLANGDLVEGAAVGQARVLAAACNYHRVGAMIVALPPQREGLVIYEPAAGKPGAYRELFSLRGEGIAAATAVMDAKPISPTHLLVELHINPSTSCYVLLNTATGSHRDVLGIDAAVSPDGKRLAHLAGPPHFYPREEYLDVFIDGVQVRHFAGATQARLGWHGNGTVNVELDDTRPRRKSRLVSIPLAR